MTMTRATTSPRSSGTTYYCGPVLPTITQIPNKPPRLPVFAIFWFDDIEANLLGYLQGGAEEGRGVQEAIRWHGIQTSSDSWSEQMYEYGSCRTRAGFIGALGPRRMIT